MMRKFLAAVLAAALLLTLTACSKTKTPAESDPPQQTAAEEPWKAVLAEKLLENYGILPEYYEDRGDGIYQVYAEVGGEVIPVGTVDSATGEYNWQ